MALANRTLKRNSSDDPEEFRATLGEHLDELRSRIIKVVLALVVFSCAGWFIAIPVYDFIQKSVQTNIPKWLDYREVFNSFTGPFMLQLRMSVWIGVAITLPYAIWQLWLFIRPGLKPNERRPARALFPFSMGLFFLGATIGWLMVPPTVGWFCSFFRDFKGSVLYQEQGTMVFLVIKLLLAFGIGFQLPIVTFLLVKTGIVPVESLLRSWKHATVAIFALTMLLTPSGDPFTMLAMAVPLTGLFFGAIGAVKLTSKDKGREDEAHELNNLD